MKESYEPLENELNINNHETLSANEEDYRGLIMKMEDKKSKLLEILKSLSDIDRNQIDLEILNPDGMSWGSFNGIEKDNEDRVSELLRSFIHETDKEKREIIGKKLVEIIS